MADSKIEAAGAVVSERILRPADEFDGMVYQIAWSPSGAGLVGAYHDGGVRGWDGYSSTLSDFGIAGGAATTAVAWSPNERHIAAGCSDGTVSILPATGQGQSSRWLLKPKPLLRRSSGAGANAVAWSPLGDVLAVAAHDGELTLWDPSSASKPRRTRSWQLGTWIRCLTWSPDGSLLACGHGTGELRIVDSASDETWLMGGDGGGETARVWDVVWSSEGWMASVSGAGIAIWNTGTRELTTVLEGHSFQALGATLSSDGRILGSQGVGDAVLWRTDTWDPVWRSERDDEGGVFGIAFSPTDSRLAIRRNKSDIEILRVDIDALLTEPTVESVHYTTAKIVLVGDSGVGKTGLGYRLATGEYKEHSSTHGQQFWPLEQLDLRRDDGTECEAVLWDLAGQPDYRLTHSLFLDDADVAVVVFDPTDTRDPLKGVDFWRNALTVGRKQSCASVLVGGRADRGSLTLPPGEVDAYCATHGIDGGYLETSARTGTGLDELLARLRSLVRWEAMLPTVTTRTFKRIKDRVLEVKAEDIDDVVVDPARLRELIENQALDEPFTDAEMMAASRHLQRHGFVAVLRTLAGDEVILLRPELLNNLAASFVLEARRNEKGLGAVDEGRLVPGGYAFRELAGLAEREQELLLDAVTVLFLEHNICFRETLGADSFLIFPELINLRRPDVDDGVELQEDTAYRVRGAVENVYAALVVLLGYTNIFRRTQQWNDEARYEMRGGATCGLRQLAERDGELELTLLFDATVTDAQRDMFRGLFEDVLRSRKVTVERFPPLVCGSCGEQQDREDVIKRQRKGRAFVHCEECGARIEIPSTADVVGLARRVATSSPSSGASRRRAPSSRRR